MPQSVLDLIYLRYKDLPTIHHLQNAKLDKFTICDKLSSGGFGQVYDGYYIDDLGIH